MTRLFSADQAAAISAKSRAAQGKRTADSGQSTIAEAVAHFANTHADGRPSGMPAKPSKMRNRKCVTEHGRFDSEKEARRYAELLLLERAGKIVGLRRQVAFDLVVNNVPITVYKADFLYQPVQKNWQQIIEDVKPTFKTEASRKKYHATDAYRRFKMKAALMLAIHKITVAEV